MITLKKKQLIGVIGWGILVSLVAIALAWLNPLQKSQEQLSNFLYYERPTEHPIVIVGIDSNAVHVLGRLLEWPRSNYAKVVSNLLKHHPSSIGMDIFFRSPSNVIGREDLQNALSSMTTEQIKERYIDAKISPEDQALSDLIKANDNIFVISSTLLDQSTPNHSIIDLGTEPYQPDPIFQYDKDHVGNNGVWPGLSGSIYHTLPLLLYKNVFYPAISIELVNKYLGLANVSYQISADKLSLLTRGKTMDIPLDNSRMLINYTAKTLKFVDDAYQQDKITYIPFLDVLDEKYPANFDPSFLEGKIVLIGVWYRDSGDNYLTPIDQDNAMFGVAIHAQAIQTILDRAWLYNQSLPWQALTIVLLVALTMLLIFGLTIKWGLPGTALLLLLYVLVAAPLSFRTSGLILNLVYPPLAIVLAAIVGYAYRYLTESKQKTKVARALGQYVNAGVEKSVLENDRTGVERSAEKKEITVIFTDICSFTTLSEGLEPQSVVALLNEYFEVMAGVVIANDGIVDKYEGDALMAYFEGLNHQINAAKAALGMRAALPKLLEKWRNDAPLPGGEKKPEIDFRVGISTGPVVMGNMGSSQHMQYTVIGDIVNLGSRLEGANKKYQTKVMVAEATFEAIKEHFECRFLDLIKVKGKNKAVKIYELLGEQGQLSEDQVALIQAYNKGLTLYFNRQFAEALKFFNEEVLSKWPRDYLANVYAARSQKCVLFPPEPDWDFVFKMETK